MRSLVVIFASQALPYLRGVQNDLFGIDSLRGFPPSYAVLHQFMAVMAESGIAALSSFFQKKQEYFLIDIIKRV